MSSIASHTQARQHLVIGIACILLTGILAGIVFPLTANLAGMQDGDGMLTAPISTQKLTWYFWGQDRLLNLLPALAHPITDVESNLRLQVMLRALFAYLAPIGILILFSRQPRVLIVAIAIANIILLGCLSQYAQFNLYVQHNAAGTSLVLFAVAYAVTYSRLAKAVIALLTLVICSLAYAINFALLTYSLPIIVLLGALRKTQRMRYVLFLVVNLVAVLIAWWHSRYFGEASTSYGLAISFDGLIESAKVLYDNLHLFLFTTLIMVATLCYRLSSEKRPREIGATVCVAIGLLFLLANMLWVQMNAYNIRYFLTSLIILSAIMAYPIALVAMSTRFKYSIVLLCCLVVLGNCVFLALGGLNSGYKELVNPLWRSQSAAVADVAVAQNSRVIAGGFWDVWAAVYQTKKEQHRLPEARQIAVYGATYRADVLREQFLASVLGKGEQNALCFYVNAEQCMQEMMDRFHLAPTHTLVLKKAEALKGLDKPMLSLTFEVN